jgi:hypothetical protein
MYCNANPTNYIDANGDSTRLWVETTGVGHTWITTGEGENTRVYSYGRYDDIKYPKLHSLCPAGDGVLLRLEGKEALAYLDSKSTTNPISITVTDITDEMVNNYMDAIFSSSQELPSNPNKSYYQNPSAHVIDEYNILTNNCTTFATEALLNLGSTAVGGSLYIPSSNGKGYSLIGAQVFITPIALSIHLKNKQSCAQKRQ